MFVFGSVWDYLLYSSIVSNPIGLLYIIGLVVYTALIVINLSAAANKIKWFKKRQNSRIFITILILISIVLGHIATVLTGKLITVIV
jgi:hypothetical protein